MNKLVIFLIFAIIVIVGISIIAKPKQNEAEISLLKTNDTRSQPSPVPTNIPSPTITVPTNATSASNLTIATKAIIKTSKGNITISLYDKDAPNTIANFLKKASNGFYNNLTFHRVEDWVIQGGDPDGTGGGGTSIYGETFEDELSTDSPSYKVGYVEGVLAMANRGPNTNGSQFFILKRDTPLDHAYTIFGKVTSGMDVVKKIAIGDKILTIEVQQ